jgi:hypothetical protein
MENFINALAEKFNVDPAEIKDKASHLLDQHRDQIPDQLEKPVDEFLAGDGLDKFGAQLQGLFGLSGGAIAGLLGGLTGGPTEVAPVMDVDPNAVPEDEE